MFPQHRLVCRLQTPLRCRSVDPVAHASDRRITGPHPSESGNSPVAKELSGPAQNRGHTKNHEGSGQCSSESRGLSPSLEGHTGPDTRGFYIPAPCRIEIYSEGARSPMPSPLETTVDTLLQGPGPSTVAPRPARDRSATAGCSAPGPRS